MILVLLLLTCLGSPGEAGVPDRSRLLTASNAAGTVTLGYDDLGRLTSETDVHGRTLGFSHDLTGNRTGLTYPDGTAVTHEHDALDRLERIRGPNNQALASFGYDTLSRYASLTHANGTSSTFGFDLRDNLQRISHALGGQTLDWGGKGGGKGASHEWRGFRL